MAKGLLVHKLELTVSWKYQDNYNFRVTLDSHGKRRAQYFLYQKFDEQGSYHLEQFIAKKEKKEKKERKKRERRWTLQLEKSTPIVICS